MQCCPTFLAHHVQTIDVANPSITRHGARQHSAQASLQKAYEYYLALFDEVKSIP